MKSMLIIDGSRILAPLFADLFERRGWNVDTCGDRQCAIHRLAGDWPYDSILVERVSGTDEVHLVGLIRGFEHRKTTAVVVITERREAREEVLAAGADEVLLKPVNPNALVWAVDKHVSR
jgi:DNA-binding response OmpR family regulator